VRSVTVADGLATVDLSASFALGGTPESMLARLSELVRTLTGRAGNDQSATAGERRDDRRHVPRRLDQRPDHAPHRARPATTASTPRSPRWWSVPFREWLPYALPFVGGIAFHEFGDVPAYPASHGCVRQSSSIAPWTYRFAYVGMPVKVIPLRVNVR
jgi:L,D-transpeptidase-like protein